MSKALKAAIEANDREAVRLALRKVKDVNRKLPGAKAPLLYACEKGADKVLEVLFGAGAIAEKRNTFPGDTPFAVAAEFERAEVMRKLCELKQASQEAIDHALVNAAIEGRKVAFEMVLETVKPPIPIALFNIASVPQNGDEMIRTLIAHGGDPNVRSEDSAQEGVTPLHVAAGRGNVEVMRVLVVCGAEVNARDAKGRTPLMSLATQLGWIERGESPAKAKKALEVLLKLGADAQNTDNDGNDSLAHFEFESASDQCKPSAALVKILLEAGATGSGSTGRLFDALRTKDPAAVRRAIDEGADVNHVNPFGGTPLTWAPTEEIVELLLNAGADPNKCFPLIDAAGRGKLAVVKRLIAAGADIHAVEVSGEFQQNAYEAADINRQYDVVDYLKSLGASRPKPAKSKPIMPGVESWNDFSEVLVRATVEQAAQGLAKMIGGSLQTNVYGQSFPPGSRAYIVVRPKGLAWCNVFQVAPQPRRFEDAEQVEAFACELAKASGAPVLSIEYSDTSNAASVLRVEPDGKLSRDQGWDRGSLEEMVEAMGDQAPAWAKKQLAETGENEPGSTERLVMLAQQEKFVAAAYGIYCEPGRKVDVEFTGYGADAFDGAAFVSN